LRKTPLTFGNVMKIDEVRDGDSFRKGEERNFDF
jgi:hypothetical protein